MAFSGVVLLCATFSVLTFATPTSDADTAIPTVVTATDEESTPITVTVTHIDSRGDKAYEGDLITITLTYIDNTDNVLTVFPVDSNLSGVLTTGAPNCCWHNLAAHTTKQHTIATHTVTAADIAADNFTPTSAQAATRDHNGIDVITGGITANTDPMIVTQDDRPSTPDPLETSQGYVIGDKVRLASPGLAGFSCHRIPALIIANSDWAIASWDGRPSTCQDVPQVNSVVYRIFKGGDKSWAPIKTALAGTPGAQEIGYSDPSSVVDRTIGTISLFSVKSYNVGLFQSQLGIDPVAHNILHTHVVESHDNGKTWGNPRTVTDQVTAGYKGQWFTRFASSGEGIQSRYGAHTGRLIQRYAIANSGMTSLMVVSVYSDDHGATQKPGAPAEGSAGKNRIVELSDDRLLLNPRTQGTVGQHLEAISYDNGQTRGPFHHS